jgi:hypothetical protein
LRNNERNSAFSPAIPEAFLEDIIFAVHFNRTQAKTGLQQKKFDGLNFGLELS